jgi:hypothetical protein
MHIISLLFFPGLVSGSRTQSLFQPGATEKQDGFPAYLTDLHVGIMDAFIKDRCGGKVKSATTVWNSVSDDFLKRFLLDGATNGRGQSPEINQIYCELFANLEGRAEQIAIATRVSELNPTPELMMGNRYIPVEEYISHKCTGVQLLTPMISQLEFAISSFSVSNPDKTKIAVFCHLFGGISIESQSEQMEIASLISDLHPTSKLMKGNRYQPVEKYISDKCTGVQLPNPMISQLKLAIWSFSVSVTDKDSIDLFCYYLRGQLDWV